jgi:hypothetical protein
MVNQNIAFGFKSSIGSFGAMALLAIPALLGIGLVGMSKKKDGTRNNVQFIIGLILIGISALPYLPILGLSLLFDN